MASADLLRQQLPLCLKETQLPLGERYRGKVRDTYRQGDRLILVTSDRLSAFDRVLTTIPFKGEVLNRLAAFWFEKTKHVVKNHVVDVPDPNVTVAMPCQAFAVEVVIRGYLTGSLWRDYQKSPRTPYGFELPSGMKKDQAFDQPILTPSTKAPLGEHDEAISEAAVVQRGLCSQRDWARIAEAARGLFAEGQRWAKSRGLLLVDTKYEFGRRGDELFVIDEIHTPDSSRYWMADEYAARFQRQDEQKMLDKENIRQWLMKERNFSGHGEPPTIPDEIRVDLSQKYLSAYARITGEELSTEVTDVAARVERNLKAKGYL